MKSIGLNSGKCKSNSFFYLGDSEGTSGIWYDSNEWTKRSYWKSTPLEINSCTLGGRSSEFKGIGPDLRGSGTEVSFGWEGIEEEGVWSLIIKEACLTSLSGSDKGKTISESEWDLVCLEGAKFGFCEVARWSF